MDRGTNNHSRLFRSAVVAAPAIGTLLYGGEVLAAPVDTPPGEEHQNGEMPRDIESPIEGVQDVTGDSSLPESPPPPPPASEEEILPASVTTPPQTSVDMTNSTQQVAASQAADPAPGASTVDIALNNSANITSPLDRPHPTDTPPPQESPDDDTDNELKLYPVVASEAPTGTQSGTLQMTRIERPEPSSTVPSGSGAATEPLISGVSNSSIQDEAFNQGRNVSAEVAGSQRRLSPTITNHFPSARVSAPIVTDNTPINNFVTSAVRLITGADSTPTARFPVVSASDTFGQPSVNYQPTPQAPEVLSIDTPINVQTDVPARVTIDTTGIHVTVSRDGTFPTTDYGTSQAGLPASPSSPPIIAQPNFPPTGESSGSATDTQIAPQGDEPPLAGNAEGNVAELAAVPESYRAVLDSITAPSNPPAIEQLRQISHTSEEGILQRSAGYEEKVAWLESEAAPHITPANYLAFEKDGIDTSMANDGIFDGDRNHDSIGDIECAVLHWTAGYGEDPRAMAEAMAAREGSISVQLYTMPDGGVYQFTPELNDKTHHATVENSNCIGNEIVGEDLLDFSPKQHASNVFLVTMLHRQMGMPLERDVAAIEAGGLDQYNDYSAAKINRALGGSVIAHAEVEGSHKVDPTARYVNAVYKDAIRLNAEIDNFIAQRDAAAPSAESAAFRARTVAPPPVATANLVEVENTATERLGFTNNWREELTARNQDMEPHKLQFMLDVYQVFMELQQEGFNIHPAAATAQVNWESGFGTSENYLKSNNPLGMQTTDPNVPHIPITDNGEPRMLRTFPTLKDALRYYAEKTVGREWFQDASHDNCYQNVESYINGLQNEINEQCEIVRAHLTPGVMSYAEDPSYVDKLLGTIRDRGLLSVIQGVTAGANAERVFENVIPPQQIELAASRGIDLKPDGSVSMAVQSPLGRDFEVKSSHLHWRGQSFIDSVPGLNNPYAHVGLDIRGSEGEHVVAPFAGRVHVFPDSGGIGNAVIIEGPDGVVVQLGHLQGFADGLVDGQVVGTGDHVAFLGSSGTSTAPHLDLKMARFTGDIRTFSSVNGGDDYEVLNPLNYFKEGTVSFFYGANTDRYGATGPDDGVTSPVMLKPDNELLEELGINATLVRQEVSSGQGGAGQGEATSPAQSALSNQPYQQLPQVIPRRTVLTAGQHSQRLQAVASGFQASFLRQPQAATPAMQPNIFGSGQQGTQATSQVAVRPGAVETEQPAPVVDRTLSQSVEVIVPVLSHQTVTTPAQARDVAVEQSEAVSRGEMSYAEALGPRIPTRDAYLIARAQPQATSLEAAVFTAIMYQESGLYPWAVTGDSEKGLSFGLAGIEEQSGEGPRNAQQNLDPFNNIANAWRLYQSGGGNQNALEQLWETAMPANLSVEELYRAIRRPDYPVASQEERQRLDDRARRIAEEVIQAAQAAEPQFEELQRGARA